MNFQDVILELNKFWARKGCVMVQPYDLEVGAGTRNRGMSLTFSHPGGPQTVATAIIPTVCSITISIRCF
jgi:glycyl-tRNA synthetase alpha chain